MALCDLLKLSDGNKKIGLSEERILENMDELRSAFSFYREYPDIFVDLLKGNSTFELYTYQRIFLRMVMRHRLAYCVYPRAYSKSFLSILVLMLRCILYPGAKLFVTTGGKEQAASITKEKVNELCELIPGLKREIDWRPGQTLASKDMVRYQFKNGSRLDIMASKQSSRGQRRTGGLIEETILVDQTALQEIIIPTMNVSRLLPDGTRDDNETTNKSQIYVTTAGWKNSFAYEKLIQVLVWSILKPNEAIITGGTWRTPVLERLLSKSFVAELKSDGEPCVSAVKAFAHLSWGYIYIKIIVYMLTGKPKPIMAW